MPATRQPDVRPLAAADFDPLWALLSLAFAEDSGGDLIEHERALFEPERSLGVWDGGQLVGATYLLSMHMTAPGGADLPVAGVTGVGVAATHRRRGIQRAMMTRQLADVRELGRESTAVLWASEGGIYGRYGYGVAAPRMTFSVARPAAGLIDRPSPDVQLRYSPADADVIGPLYEASRLARPGGLARPDSKWALLLSDLPSLRQGTSRLVVVVAEAVATGGVAQEQPVLEGYVAYRTGRAGTGGGTGGGTEGEVRVQEMHATTPRAAHALWAHVLDLDLMRTTSCWNVPVDLPLMHQLRAPRELDLTWRDGLWVRIVDLPAALAQRTYAADCDLVLEVRDELCPWNAGTWRLVVSGGSAEATRTDRSADLALSTTDLATAYLGGPTLTARAAAGLVAELRPGAVREASRAFSGDIAPWPTDMF